MLDRDEFVDVKTTVRQRYLRGCSPMQLSLERRDVTPAEAPLPALLERGKNALARKFVDGVRAEIQEPSDFLAVQKNIVFLDHPSIPATNLVNNPGSGRSSAVRRIF